VVFNPDTAPQSKLFLRSIESSVYAKRRCYVIASALSAAAPTEGKIAIATSQGYFMELLCRYWKIRKPFMSSGTMGRPISV
jgi:hypothetical protein